MTFCELKQKEVINICDGRRLGCVCDLQFDAGNGAIAALVVPTPMRWRSLWRSDCGLEIPWNCIRKMGDDVILVETNLDRVFEKPDGRRR